MSLGSLFMLVRPASAVDGTFLIASMDNHRAHFSPTKPKWRATLTQAPSLADDA